MCTIDKVRLRRDRHHHLGCRSSECICASVQMLIKGIRSFSPDNQMVVEFYKPLTLIVGHNGAGKTVGTSHWSTTFECIPIYICTTCNSAADHYRMSQASLHRRASTQHKERTEFHSRSKGDSFVGTLRLNVLDPGCTVGCI